MAEFVNLIKPNGTLFGMRVSATQNSSRKGFYLTAGGQKSKKKVAYNDTFGHEKASANAPNTWFGMRVWDSEDDMKKHGGGPYWKVVKVKGQDRRVIMYRAGVGKANKQWNVRNRLIASVKQDLLNRKPNTLAGAQNVIRDVVRRRTEQPTTRPAKPTKPTNNGAPRTPSPGPNASTPVNNLAAKNLAAKNLAAKPAVKSTKIPKPPKSPWSANRSVYTYKANGTKYAIPGAVLEGIRRQYGLGSGLATNNEAAAKIYVQFTAPPAKEQSGWRVDETSLNKVYYHWDGKRHVKFTDAEMRAANQNAARATLLRRQGWSKNAANFVVVNDRGVKKNTKNDSGSPKLVKVSAKNVAAVKSRFGMVTNQNAAAKYLQLKRTMPPKEKSNWGYDVTNASFPRVFYVWNAGKKRHDKLTTTNINAANGNKDLALRRTKVGWNKDKTTYTALTKDNAKLVKIPAETLATIKKRLVALRPLNQNRTDAHAAEAYVRSLAANGNTNAGRFNFTKNAYIASGGAVVPGNIFVNEYGRRRKANANAAARNSGKRTNDTNDTSDNNDGQKRNFFGAENLANARIEFTRANNVATVHARNTLTRVASGLEKERRLVDMAELAKLPKDGPADGNNFPQWLAGLFRIGGPLKGRPLLTGNVGTPESGVSPADELETQRGDGCARLGKRWAGMQGASLMVHQAVVFTMANLRAQNMVRTPGLLALHSVGAGKTVAGLSAMLAFWNTHWAILPVSVRSNQDGNGLDKLAEEAVKYFPWFRSGDTYPFANGKMKAREALVERLRLGHKHLGAKHAVNESHLLASVTTIMSDLCGAKGYLRGGKTLQNCIFIVDEIQMLLSPPPTEKQYQKNFDAFVALLKRRDRKSTWVLGMTATPGETIEQVESILQMVAGGDKRFNSGAAIKANATGIVSFAYVAGDLTRHAKVNVIHECLPLSEFDKGRHMFYTTLYFNRLLRLEETRDAVIKVRGVMSEVPKPLALPSNAYHKYVAKDKSKFYSRIRQKTEFIQMNNSGLFVFDSDNNNNNMKNNTRTNNVKLNDIENFKQRLEDAAQNAEMPVVKTRSIVAQAPTRAANASRTRGVTGTTGTTGTTGSTAAAAAPQPPRIPRENYFILSPKLVGVVQSIIENPGVHYVYSMEPRSLRLIAHVLDSRFGYSMYPTTYTTSPAKRYCFIDPLPESTVAMYNPTAKTYTRQREVKRSHIKVLLGDIKEKRDGVLMSDLNAGGGICRVVLATRASYKGVDIRHVRHVHAVSTLPDYIDVLQLVGRGPRNCGHRALRVDMRRVTFHHWRFVPGPAQKGAPAGGGARCPSTKEERVLYPDCVLAARAMTSYDAGYALLENALAGVAVDRILFKEFGKASEELHAALRSPCATTKIPTLVAKMKKTKKNERILPTTEAQKKATLQKRLVVWKRRLLKHDPNARKIVDDLTNRLKKLQ